MSKKQEYIHLHQLCAHIRLFLQANVPALEEKLEIEQLPEYKDAGITSLNINADTETQVQAVNGLLNDLTDNSIAVALTGKTQNKLLKESTSRVPSDYNTIDPVVPHDLQDQPERTQPTTIGNWNKKTPNSEQKPMQLQKH